MKNILFVCLLAVAAGCNNTDTTPKPTDLDRTDNDDTAVHLNTGTQPVQQNNLTDSSRHDSTGTQNNH